MGIEAQLRDRLRKVEALFAGAATAGEKNAAEAALDRLKARLAGMAREEPPEELKFTMPDQWSMRLFMALCRRYGLKPYRYYRQRRTTIMVKAPRRFLDEILWRQFTDLHADLIAYLETTTETLIRDSVFADTSEAEEVAEPVALR